MGYDNTRANMELNLKMSNRHHLKGMTLSTAEKTLPSEARGHIYPMPNPYMNYDNLQDQSRITSRSSPHYQNQTQPENYQFDISKNFENRKK